MKWTSRQWTWKQCEILKLMNKKTSMKSSCDARLLGGRLPQRAGKKINQTKCAPHDAKQHFQQIIQVAGPGRPQLLWMLQRWVAATKATKCCCNSISNSAKARAWCGGHGPLRWRQPAKCSRLHSSMKNVQPENHLPITWTLTFSNDFYSKIKE